MGRTRLCRAAAERRVPQAERHCGKAGRRCRGIRRGIQHQGSPASEVAILYRRACQFHGALRVRPRGRSSLQPRPRDDPRPLQANPTAPSALCGGGGTLCLDASRIDGGARRRLRAGCPGRARTGPGLRHPVDSGAPEPDRPARLFRRPSQARTLPLLLLRQTGPVCGGLGRRPHPDRCRTRAAPRRRAGVRLHHEGSQRQTARHVVGAHGPAFRSPRLQGRLPAALSRSRR